MVLQAHLAHKMFSSVSLVLLIVNYIAQIIKVLKQQIYALMSIETDSWTSIPCHSRPYPIWIFSCRALLLQTAWCFSNPCTDFKQIHITSILQIWCYHTSEQHNICHQIQSFNIHAHKYTILMMIITFSWTTWQHLWFFFPFIPGLCFL